MRKLSTYPMLLAVMLVCIAAKVGYASSIYCLTYEYRGNQVTRISDDAPELTYFNAFHFVDGADDDVEYTYDSSGNTVSDLNRGINRISYDVNHRPRTISFSNGAHTGYIYDALVYFISDIATDGFGIDYSTPEPIINKWKWFKD